MNRAACLINIFRGGVFDDLLQKQRAVMQKFLLNGTVVTVDLAATQQVR